MAKSLDLDILHYFVMLIISSEQWKTMSDSSRTNESIGKLHRVAQEMLFNCKHCFGRNFFCYIQNCRIPCMKSLAETAQFFFVSHALNEFHVCDN